VISEENRYHHAPKKLADALVRLYYQRHEIEQFVPRQEEREPQEAAAL